MADDVTTTPETEALNEAREAARLSREAPRPGDLPEGSKKQWYVIHTYSGYENKVKANLEHRIESMGMEDKIFQVLVPMEDEIEIRQGQRHTVQKKVYPGYVLVEMTMNQETAHVINSIQGVIKFVGQDRKLPQPLRPEEVNRLLGITDEVGTDEPKEEIPFMIGQAVEITEGPFTEFSGTVEEVMPDKGKVRVTVSLFGRPTSVELDYLQLRAY